MYVYMYVVIMASIIIAAFVKLQVYIHVYRYFTFGLGVVKFSSFIQKTSLKNEPPKLPFFVHSLDQVKVLPRILCLQL